MTRILLVVFVLISFSGFGQNSKSETQTLMTVAERPVAVDEFLYLYKKNNQGKKEAFQEGKINEYLSLYTNFKLKIAEARARGLDTTRKFNDEFRTYREELKRPYRAEPDMLSKLTREAYDRLSEEIRASHILIMVAPDAAPEDTIKAYSRIKEIRGRVAGGENFFKLAQELSEDPSAKYNGGDLGYFTALQMVYPFEQAAYTLSIGSVSKIIRTRFGYHIIKLVDRKPARGEVEVSHILFRKEAEGNSDVKNKAFEVMDQLRAGRSWDELCKEFSDDGNTKNNGGRLRPFGVGALASIPEFERVAFSLEKPGDLSDPFESSVGWHIVRLERKIPLAPFAEAEPQLKRKVSKDERVQLSEKILLEKRKKQFGFAENTPGKVQIFSGLDSTITKPNWKFKGTAAARSILLFTLSGKPTRGEEFIRFCENNTPVSGSSLSQMRETLYDRFVAEKLSEVEEDKLARENPDFRNLLNEYREGILLFEVMEKEVWSKASEDTVGQRKFYTDNITRYRAGERLNARVFATADKNFLNTMRQRIANRDSLNDGDLKRFKSVQNFRNYERGESKVIDRLNWVTGVQEVEADGIYYLVEVKSLVPAGTKTLADARASVISDYQDELEKKWVIELKQKFDVKVNKKAMKYVLQELTQK